MRLQRREKRTPKEKKIKTWDGPAISMAGDENLQEELLCLLAHHKAGGSLVVAKTGEEMFSGRYREVYQVLRSHWDKFGKPPGGNSDDGIFSLFSDWNEKRDSYDKAFRDLVIGIHESAGTANADNVLARLDTFVSIATLNQQVKFAFERQGNIATLEQVEELYSVLQRPLNMVSVDMGKKIFDDREERSTAGILPMGIHELDQENIGPEKKTLTVLMGGPNTGKSWWLVDVAAQAHDAGWKVLYISLEMRTDQVLERINWRMELETHIVSPMAHRRVLELRTKSVDGSLRRVAVVDRLPESAERDEKERKQVEVNRNEIDSEFLRVMDVGAGVMTVSDIEAQIRMLVDVDNFKPDIVLIDYVDLMKSSKEHRRMDIAETYQGLRRLASEMSLAMVTVSQINREGEKARSGKGIGLEHLAESFSKAMDADLIFSYQPHPALELGNKEFPQLGILKVNKSRNTASGHVFLIAQDYANGKFIATEHGAVRHTKKNEETVLKELKPFGDMAMRGKAKQEEKPVRKRQSNKLERGSVRRRSRRAEDL